MTLKTHARATVVFAALITSFQGAPAHAFSKNQWADASDVGRIVLVAAALGYPTVQADWKGALQAAASIGVTAGITAGLKEAFPEQRPDNSGNDSFPSGHTAMSFAAAATLEKRYGWQAGFPAFVVAGAVGVARHEADKHHWYDVLAGAAIGTGTGLLLTNRHDNQVRLVPWADSDGGGFLLGMQF
ncbi:membrane-associated phospholipid phosphatase [Rhodobacteraceae bacterium MBR-64]|jgi:membrane-associated phospholipid phosphatase